MDIANRIKTLRKRNVLSQEEFAETLGVTRQSVSSWENGTTTPDVKIVAAMCEQFGVTSDYLIFGENVGGKLSVQESIKSDSSKETKQQDQKSKTKRIVKQLIVYLFLTIVGIVSAMNLLLHALEFGLTTTESMLFVVCTIVVVTFGIIVYVVQNNGKKNKE
ncbi:MAG: helix-turn-helix domain-containing protein [Christensenellales bacterium]